MNELMAVAGSDQRAEAFASVLGLARERLVGRQGTAETALTFRDVLTVSGLSQVSFATQLAAHLQLDYVSHTVLSAATSLAHLFTARFLRDFGAYPFSTSELGPCIALAEAPSPAFVRASEIVLSQRPRFVVATYDDIQALLSDRLAEPQDKVATLETSADTLDDVDSLRDLASGAPVVRALNDLFEKAVEWRATDLHLEPMRDILNIRLRVDGLLRSVPPLSAKMSAAVVSRIKILSGLNIAERRLPQDGAARLRISGSQIDVRVATFPTTYGEAAVLRFLPGGRGQLDLSKIGMAGPEEQTLRRLLEYRDGIIIVTGPTGSGKTTTLAGALSHLNDKSRKILTVEDPIEYEIPGIVQTQVNPAIGLTFATALRSFLRFDPNVIMVGEVRDGETANVAVQASLTGHLVMTTLHTETASAAVPRLINLGVEHYLLQSTLRAVISQRLVRALCPHCKTSTSLTCEAIVAEPKLQRLGLQAGDRIGQSVGCERCENSGYRGRLGIFEILEITPPLRALIGRETDLAALEAQARVEGMRSMRDYALDLCKAGQTSIAEIYRVVTVR